MLLNIMLYIIHAYLMLFTALLNAVCLHNNNFFAIDFCKCFFFHALTWVIDTVPFKYYFESCAVLLICWFS